MDFQSTHKGLGVSHVLYNMLSPFAEVSTAFVGNCCHVPHHMHVNFTTSFLIAVLLAGTTQPRLTTQIGTNCKRKVYLEVVYLTCVRADPVMCAERATTTCILLILRGYT